MKTTMLWVFIGVLSFQFVSSVMAGSASDARSLRWDSETKECSLKPGETAAAFQFVATNISNADVTIHRLQASCGCTAARLPTMPYTLRPGSNVAIQVEMQLAGKRGLIRKSVMVDTSAGLQSLTVSANIPTEPTTTETR